MPIFPSDIGEAAFFQPARLLCCSMQPEVASFERLLGPRMLLQEKHPARSEEVIDQANTVGLTEGVNTGQACEHYRPDQLRQGNCGVEFAEFGGCRVSDRTAHGTDRRPGRAAHPSIVTHLRAGRQTCCRKRWTRARARPAS